MPWASTSPNRPAGDRRPAVWAQRGSPRPSPFPHAAVARYRVLRPFPGGRSRREAARKPAPPAGGGPGSSVSQRSIDDRVNVAALRDITDESGGRTEIIRSARDLEPATSGIADEFSRQYYMGYAATGLNVTAAGTRSASRCGSRATASGRGAGYVAAAK